MKKEKIIVIDTETTGLDPLNDEILQLSIIDDDKNVLFSEYFKPEYKTEWAAAMDVNKITPEMVSDKHPIKDRIEEIQAIIDNADTIVGYNTIFDIDILKAAGINFFNQENYDVMREFAPIYGEVTDDGSYKWKSLTKCAEYYGFDWKKTGLSAHDSLADAYATLYCYKKIRYEEELSYMMLFDEMECVSIVDVAKNLGYSLRKISDNEYTLRENESIKIFTDSNVYYHDSTLGNVIDFAKEFGDMNCLDAIEFVGELEGSFTLEEIECVKSMHLNSTEEQDIEENEIEEEI